MSELTGYVPPGFELLQRLGTGQTSVVWLATEKVRARDVALKLPKPSLHANPLLRRMFENEVHITLKLDHPNVVRAYDGRPTGPQAFLSLEYCPGGTLDQLLLERGRVPLERAKELVHQVAMGLDHTHAAKVLHRDVKPANVFLGAAGEAKLGDFGTGTFQGDDAAERVGTAFYMAPEVFEGTATTVRSDVYSLGVLAYEVLAGERPFVGETYDALMFAHLHSLPRDLRTARPELGRALAAVVGKALARDAARRYPDITTFLSAYREAAGLVGPAGGATTSNAPVTGRGGPRRGDPAAEAPAPEPERRSGDRRSADDATEAPARGWWPFGRRRGG